MTKTSWFLLKCKPPFKRWLQLHESRGNCNSCKSLPQYNFIPLILLWLKKITNTQATNDDSSKSEQTTDLRINKMKSFFNRKKTDGVKFYYSGMLSNEVQLDFIFKLAEG